ncbi:hypothetical protein FA95DRAFT_1612188 [Auriscalpium vulgare]|uniref:Uncharacterized protein n=1 Tax=Auriscalpium vulgare TaxID=40419 RepID=A0ACB8R8N7_9AGAM|nr:hypothetical protein FA95DRAFT_1612188 [Auriscalpium vulgare]
MTPPQLPFDVHARILQFVYITSQSHEVDYRTLYACALACKDWVPLSQRLLFRRIPYRGRDWLRNAIPFLLHTFTRSPHLGTYVHSIPITIESDRMASYSQPKHTYDYDLLRCCPHIAQVQAHLDIPGFPYTAALSKLRALSLRPTALVAFMYETDVVEMLAVWPSVRHIVVKMATPSMAVLDVPLPTQLRSVACTGSVYFNSADPRAQPCLAEHSFEELEVGRLRLCLPMHTGDICRIGDSLRILTCTNMPSSFDIEWLTRLESLVLGALQRAPFTLPRTLRHFGYHVQGAEETEPRRLAQLVGDLVSVLADESALPALREVSVTRASSQDVLQAFDELRETRGAELVVYPDAESYPRARYVDWIS